MGRHVRHHHADDRHHPVNFRPTAISGCLIVEPTLVRDHRGFFTRVYCDDEFTQRNLEAVTAQVSLSYSDYKGTLRGLHYQTEPYGEAKLVRCTRGRVFDVAVDLRPASPTHRRWLSIELSADNRLALYIPVGMAHGFLTLEPDTELLYQISRPYAPDAAKGIRWDDPAIDVAWPALPAVISDRDRSWPLLRDPER